MAARGDLLRALLRRAARGLATRAGELVTGVDDAPSRARNASDALVAAAGAGATIAGATLWLAGPFLPFEPPMHAWLLGAGCALGVVGLGARLLGAGGRASTLLCVLGIALLAAFPLWMLGPVRASTRGIEAHDSVPAPRRPQRVRVLSYNVLHGYPRFETQEARLAALGRALASLQPDLVLFQEAWCTRRHGCLVNRLATGDGALAGYHLAYAPVNGSLRLIGFEEGLAIASRWPIERVQVRELRPRERPWRHRAALEAVVRIDGVAWTLVTSHLANLDSKTREAQARSLEEALPQGGVLVLGADLNAPAGSPTVEALTTKGLAPVLAGERDHVLVRGFASAGDGWRVGDSRWVLTGSDLQSLTGQRDPISDHPAAWVELVRGDS